MFNKPVSNDVLEHISKDGKHLFKYDKTTGEFALGDKDGNIVSLNKPRFNTQFDPNTGMYDPSIDWKKKGFEEYWIGKVKNQ